MSRYYRDADWIMDSKDDSLVYDGLPGRAGDLVCELLERLDYWEHRKPNRVVIEIVNGFVKRILAERIAEALVIIHDPVAADICESYGGDYEPRVFGDGGEPIEALAIERTAVGVVGALVEVRFEVAE